MPELVRRTAELMTTPLARLAVPGLVTKAASDPVLHQRILSRCAADGWRGLDAALAAAAARGELAEDVDVLVVLELVIGAVLVALLVRGLDAMDAAWVATTARTVLHGVGRRPSA